MTETLNTRKFMIAWGVTFAILFFLFGIAGMMGIGTDFVDMASHMYIGFTPTFIGSLVGAFWGYVEGTVLGLLIAYIYNRI